MEFFRWDSSSEVFEQDLWLQQTNWEATRFLKTKTRLYFLHSIQQPLSLYLDNNRSLLQLTKCINHVSSSKYQLVAMMEFIKIKLQVTGLTITQLFINS